jgi:hypothetical protein
VLSNGGKCNDFNITVNGKVIAAANKFNLLGVTYNRRFATTQHDKSVAKAARQRASLIARLSHYLPRGRYLRQLAAGLVLGKINHCSGRARRSRHRAILGKEPSLTGRSGAQLILPFPFPCIFSLQYTSKQTRRARDPSYAADITISVSMYL